MSVETGMKPRSEAQRAASRTNGSRGKGPRSPEGRVRSSVNRTVHGLNSVRLLLATEDVEEYRQHVDEWFVSLGPETPAERQIVLLVADLMWRLKRIGRIEERRALALLGDAVEKTPEWKTRSHANDAVVGLDTIARIVSTSPVPVPSMVAGGFLAGVRGVKQMLDLVRESLPVEMWPEPQVCAFLMSEQNLAKEVETQESVSEAFIALGTTATTLAAAVRTLGPALDAAVEKARTVISTEMLLADDEDRRYERHRRILEASMARQLDLLAKVRATARPSVSSGSFERASPVELRVVRA